MTKIKTIVVTGSSSGLGKYIAESANEEGHNVIGLSRSGKSSSFREENCDVSDPIQVKEVFKKIKKEENFSCLINAAGIASMNLFLSTPTETMKNIFNVNVLGSLYCSQSALKSFARNKKDEHKTIINFSTIAVNLALKGEVVYVASKGAIESFSRSLAREAADFNCNVNVIAPGPVDTKLIKNIADEKINKIIERQIIQKKAGKEDIWSICKFLISKDSKSITGQIFNINGA